MEDPKTILLLEDEAAAQHAITKTLQNKLLNPIRVLETTHEAMEYLDLHSQQTDAPFPILLMVDVKASDQSGLEILSWCREHANPRIKELAVAIVTHLLDTAIFRDIYSLGADAYFSKPFEYGEFDEWVVDSKKLRTRLTSGGRYLALNS